MSIKQLTSEEAINFADNKEYAAMSDIEIAKFQINQKCLCMSWSVFHKAVANALNRPVFTHEFVSPILKDQINAL